MGYQFVHLQCYARKPDQAGGSVHSVLREAARDPEYSAHVAHPEPPHLIYGMPLNELEALHDSLTVKARTRPQKGSPRRLRRDQKTLCTVIASYPEPRKSADREAVKQWEDLNIAWLRKRYGDQLKSVILHVDEAHLHLHAYVLSGDPEMRAQMLNPGAVAKTQYVAEHLAEAKTNEDRKALNKQGDRAYRQAMRDYQDDYWHSVGIPCGLTRMGPGKRRLSRNEWRTEQHQAETVAELQHTVRDLSAEIDEQASARDETEAALSELQERTAQKLEQADAAEGKARTAIEAEARARAETRRQRRLGISVEREAHTKAAAIITAAKTEAAKYHRFGWKVGRLLFAIKQWTRRKPVLEAQQAAIAKLREHKTMASEKRHALLKILDAEKARSKALRSSFDEAIRKLSARDAELARLRPRHVQGHQLRP